MQKNFLGFNLDFLGFLASFLCAIHCALLPLILTFSFLGGLSWMADARVESTFIVISILLALASLYPSYKNKHGNIMALLVAGIGFILLFFSRLVAHGGSIEITTIVLGGILIATAHYINWRLLRKFPTIKKHSFSDNSKITSANLKKAS